MTQDMRLIEDMDKRTAGAPIQDYIGLVRPFPSETASERAKQNMCAHLRG